MNSKKKNNPQYALAKTRSKPRPETKYAGEEGRSVIHFPRRRSQGRPWEKLGMGGQRNSREEGKKGGGR